MTNSAPLFKSEVPDLGSGPVPVDGYLSPEIYRLEIERIFRRSWLLACRADDLIGPGSYRVEEFPGLSTSVLITCDSNSNIRAFHNICRHRCHRVALEKEKRASGLMCEFHGWTYDLTGNLVSIPDEKSFIGIDKKKYGLVEIACDVWEGFIFVNLDPNPRQTLREFLGETYQLFDGFPINTMSRRATIRAELNCNWKLAMDAFMEAYHVIGLHRRTAPDSFNGPGNPYGHLHSIRTYGPHRSIHVYGNPEQKFSPSTRLNVRFAQAATYAPAGTRGDVALPPGVNPDRRTDWAFDETTIFPNFHFYTANGWALVVRYWPVDTEKCVYESTLYMAEPENAAQRVAIEQTAVMLFDVTLEDLSTVERTQDVLKCGAVTEMVLSRMETAIRHNHQACRAAIAQP